jgi:circadian clock protein KaiC
MIESGSLSIVQVEPLRYTADEFAHEVRREVEERDAQIVMLDSIAGYRLCLRGGDLVSHLHSLGTYLRNMGATVLLINEIETLADFRATELGISYLADDIVFLRYIELNGQLRHAVGVLKKRLSGFESTLRELEMTRSGVHVGRPLTELRGILSSHPEIVGPGERTLGP